MYGQTCKTKRISATVCTFGLLAAIICVPNFGCRKQARTDDLNILQPLNLAGQNENVSAQAPDLASEVNKTAPVKTYDIPRFAVNSPFDGSYKAPIPKKAKRLWARSCLWDKPPEFVVEKWLSDRPETKGKYVLIEFWATWCSQCRRAVPLLNELHDKYKEELVVMGISDEKEQTVRNFENPKIEYNIAIDTKARMKSDLAVKGIPHVIIIEPGGHVVWEGFPLLNGYELTEDVVERILAVGRNAKANAAAGQ